MTPPVVDRETWLRARAALLTREKAHRRAPQDPTQSWFVRDGRPIPQWSR